MPEEITRYEDSAVIGDSTVIGVLGGGYGEPPVRVADLEEAARQASARRRCSTGIGTPTDCRTREG
jgi:hypothetical protein